MYYYFGRILTLRFARITRGEKKREQSELFIFNFFIMYKILPLPVIYNHFHVLKTIKKKNSNIGERETERTNTREYIDRSLYVLTLLKYKAGAMSVLLR